MVSDSDCFPYSRLEVNYSCNIFYGAIIIIYYMLMSITVSLLLELVSVK